MKIGLLGYGKMGKMVEAVAEPHKVVEPAQADVLIDFSHAACVREHIEFAIEQGIPLVIGTTGWYDEMDAFREMIEGADIGVVYGPNFSIGVHLMMQIVNYANDLISHFPEYDIAGYESHHKHKVDAPSGTALKLGVPFSSVRVGYDPGTHTVIYDSEVDTLEITHRARSREGFAKGAIKAAEWIKDKKGFYSFDKCMEGLWKG